MRLLKMFRFQNYNIQVPCPYRCGRTPSRLVYSRTAGRCARSPFFSDSDHVPGCSRRVAAIATAVAPVEAPAPVAGRVDVLATAAAPTAAVVYDADPAALDQLRQAPVERAWCPEVGPHAVVTIVLPSRVFAPTTHRRRLVQRQPVLHRIHDHVRVHRLTVTEVLQQYARDQRGHGDVFRPVGAVFQSVHRWVVGRGICRRLYNEIFALLNASEL